MSAVLFHKVKARELTNRIQPREPLSKFVHTLFTFLASSIIANEAIDEYNKLTFSWGAALLQG